jgi:integrase
VLEPVVGDTDHPPAKGDGGGRDSAELATNARRRRRLSAPKDHLGHASIRTTSDRYGHLYQAARDRLRDHLEDTYADNATVNTNTV